jgi:hypothetical protein
MVLRNLIVDCARTYLGTKFRHQGRSKGAALDCVGLPYCVAAELGLRSRDGKPIVKDENLNYPAQPMDDFVLTECRRLLVEKPAEQMLAGDVLCIKMPLVPCHVAIVSTVYEGTANECFGIIHSYAPARKVVETVINNAWRSRIAGCFAFSEAVE